MSLSSSVINFLRNFWARRTSLRVFPDSLRILLSTLLRMLLPPAVDIARDHPLNPFHGEIDEEQSSLPALDWIGLLERHFKGTYLRDTTFLKFSKIRLPMWETKRGKPKFVFSSGEMKEKEVNNRENFLSFSCDFSGTKRMEIEKREWESTCKDGIGGERRGSSKTAFEGSLL